MPSDSLRLTVEAAADYIGLSTSTLNKLRVFGGGPVFLKLGRRVAYDVADLDAWLASRRRRSTPGAQTGIEASFLKRPHVVAAENVARQTKSDWFAGPVGDNKIDDDRIRQPGNRARAFLLVCLVYQA